jgi:hypothetical protein
VKYLQKEVQYCISLAVCLLDTTVLINEDMMEEEKAVMEKII